MQNDDTNLSLTSHIGRPKKKAGPKAKPKRQEDKQVEVIVHIPLAYNDGTKIPEATLIDIHEQLAVKFDGWTDDGIVKGAYRMGSGELKVEFTLKISVILLQSQVPLLKSMVSGWAETLGQETMLVKVMDFQVIFVPPHKEEG